MSKFYIGNYFPPFPLFISICGLATILGIFQPMMADEYDFEADSVSHTCSLNISVDESFATCDIDGEPVQIDLGSDFVSSVLYYSFITNETISHATCVSYPKFPDLKKYCKIPEIPNEEQNVQ